MKLDPKNYVKLFNGKESVLLSYLETHERMRMTKDGFPNIENIYLDSQQLFLKRHLDKYNFSDRKILSAINKVRRIADACVRKSEKYLDKDFGKLTWAELKKHFRIFLNSWGGFLRVIDVPVYIAHNFERGVIEEIIRAGFSHEDFDILSHPLDHTYHQRRNRDLIMIKIKKMTREEFKKEWAWSNMELARYNALGDEFINEQIKLIDNPRKQLIDSKENHKKALLKFKRVYRKLPKKLQLKADITQKLLWIRDYRYEQFIKAAFNFYGLLEEMARRLKITYSDLISMTPPEIISGEIPSNIPARQRKLVNIRNVIYTGKQADYYYNIFNKISKSENQVIGKGVSAGVVRGVAKVVRSVKEFGKVNKGDVIVCEITMPDYLPVLAKVSAIVADIGGFTSHSAIVARELGIPCIVGTQNGTKIIKDNDLIEVDANKGIVKIL